VQLDIATLKDISWPLDQALPFVQVVDVLRRLIWAFDRPLVPDVVERFGERIVVVWLTVEENATPVRSLRGRARVEDNLVIWEIRDDDLKFMRELIRQTGGTLVIDLNCDFVLDLDRHQPASACTTLQFGDPLPRPGGIMRAWLQVLGG